MSNATLEKPRLLLERRGPILIVTLNRPEVKNACDGALARAINDAMDTLDNEHGLFIGIITGAGGDFSAGADLKAVARGEGRETLPRGGFGVFKKPPRKPLIAAVEGVAVGGGLELCLACDIVIASRTARMGLPEVRHNVVAIGGGLFRLPKRIPYHIAMELALSGTLKDAEYFARFGLVNHVVDGGTALDEALKFADRLLVNGPTALAATKEIIRQGMDWSDDAGWEKQMPIANIALDSADRIEGLKAFAEKRKPVWTGK